MPPHLSQVPFPVQFRASNRCQFGVRVPPARLRSSDERPPMPVHSGQLNRNALRQGCPQNGRFQLCPVGRGHNHAPHKVARVDRARRSPSQSEASGGGRAAGDTSASRSAGARLSRIPFPQCSGINLAKVLRSPTPARLITARGMNGEDTCNGLAVGSPFRAAAQRARCPPAEWPTSTVRDKSRWYVGASSRRRSIAALTSWKVPGSRHPLIGPAVTKAPDGNAALRQIGSQMAQLFPA